jgi:hypothetical protein
MGAVIRYRDHAGASSHRNEVVMAVEARVVIMGVEVTDYLVGDISVTRNVDGSEGTCSFNLDNNFDRFIIRAENLGGTTPPYRFDQGQAPGDYAKLLTGLSNYAQQNASAANTSWIEDALNDKRCTFTFDEQAKKDMFSYKAIQMLEFAKVENIASLYQDSTSG